MLTKQLLVWMMHFAGEVAGYPVPATQPVIVWERPSQIDFDVPNSLAYMDVRGPEAGIIHMPTTCYIMTTRRCQGILVHEITHYLQWKAGEYKREPQCLGPWEKEAYMVEDVFYRIEGEVLADYGISPSELAAIISCGNPWENNKALSQ